MHGGTKLAGFLFKLLQCALFVRPVKTDLGGFFLHLASAHECGQLPRHGKHFVRHRFAVFRSGFDFVPVDKHFVRVCDLCVAEHVRVALNQLFANAVCNI